MSSRAPKIRSGLWPAVLAASLLACGAASAQTNPALQNPRVQSAYSEWRKLSQSEVDCIDNALRSRRSSLWIAIQQGMKPGDAPMMAVRAACRSNARGPSPATAAQRATQALASNAETRTTDPDLAAAERYVREKANAEKAAERAAAEKAALTEKLAALEKAAAEKAKAEKLAAEKAAAEKAKAEKLAAEKAAAEKLAAEKAAAEKAAAEKAVADTKIPDADQANLEESKLDNERFLTAGPMTPEAALAYAMADSRMSFVYGLISGPLVFSFGGVVFLLLARRRHNLRLAAIHAHGDGSAKPNELDHLVAAVLSELDRRGPKGRSAIHAARDAAREAREAARGDTTAH